MSNNNLQRHVVVTGFHIVEPNPVLVAFEKELLDGQCGKRVLVTITIK